ncbi:MAG: hypothetical protein DRH06_03285 [Deltaproteobacteria bacterium]|nr:MAG: hypothetical protein DRH06_03285 [Deltaproteobacteria bacterium]
MAPVIKFSPGEILLIGTDGIWETRNTAGEMFGAERVIDLLIRHADASADSIASQLLTELDIFRGEHSRDDDITLMVVKAL